MTWLRVALQGVGGVAIALIALCAVYGLVLAGRGFSAREEPSALEVRLARVLRSLSVPAKAKELKGSILVSSEGLAAARAHWADHCAGCHANNGSGNTMVGRNLYPRAPDMRTSTTQRLSDGELYYVIQNGVRLTGMPAWGEEGDHDLESWGLVAFIRHLPLMTPEEEKSMQALNSRSADMVQEREDEDDFLGGVNP